MRFGAGPDLEQAALALGTVDPQAPVLNLGGRGEPGALKGGAGTVAACRGWRVGTARSPFSPEGGKTRRALRAAAET